jgi:protein-tyrosine phosphatase
VIDLHSHLLPAIDDGPEDMEGAVALARAAAADGTRVLAATPHCREDHPRVKAAELAARADEVRARLAAEAVALEIVQGGEVSLTWAAGASEDDLRRVSFGGRGADLLIETPHAPLPRGFEMSLEAVALRGYRIVLAHPENNPSFQTQPARLRELAAQGIVLQVTARSLLGGRRSVRATALARSLVADGVAHVLASDAHSAGAFRPPQLAAGAAAVATLAGDGRARWMVEDAPAAILAGAPVPPRPPAVPPEPRGLRARLWGARRRT